jgi:ADP-ribosylglycohydrolase
MTSTSTSPFQAAILGAFVGDSTALGAHWIYDRAEIVQRFGTTVELHAPATTYHPGKQAGDLTHLGDQMKILHESVRATGGRFDAADFMLRWRGFWKAPGNQSYPDKATRQTLAALEGGASLLDAGAESEELAGPARGMVAIAAGLEARLSLAELIDAATLQTRLTHRSVLAEETAAFLTRLMFAIGTNESPDLQAALDASLNAASPQVKALCAKAETPQVSRLSTGDAIQSLGQSCSLPAALPATVLLLRRHGHDFAAALTENVLAGGDSAARGIVVGGVLGLVHGHDAIPAAWSSGLQHQPV